MEDKKPYDKENVKKLKSQRLLVFEDIYHIKLELAHKCNRKCDFCGMSRVNPGIMEKEVFYASFKGVGDSLRRVDFVLHGEPTLSPYIYEYTKFIRDNYPKVQISVLTNSDIYRKIGFEKLLELYDMGMTTFHVDLYDKDQSDWFLSSLKTNEKEFKKRGIEIYDYYKDKVNVFSYRGPSKRFLVYVDGEWEGINHEKICTRDFHTWGGNFPIDKWKEFNPDLKLSQFPMKKICTEPMKYFPVKYNGDVTICCRDGGRATTVGNVLKESPGEIWKGDNFQVIRRLLSKGQRQYLLSCSLCNYRSFRVGLNPYWGREYSSSEIFSILDKVQNLDHREPLYSNLVQANKELKLPKNIRKKIQGEKDES